MNVSRFRFLLEAEKLEELPGNMAIKIVAINSKSLLHYNLRNLSLRRSISDLTGPFLVSFPLIS